MTNREIEAQKKEDRGETEKAVYIRRMQDVHK